MSASCERRRGKSSSGGFWADSPRRTNTISMSRVIIVSVLAFAALVQTAHGEGSSNNSTTNQAHKPNESSASNGDYQNGLAQVKWPQTNHTEQASTSQQPKLTKLPGADPSKPPVTVPVSSSEAPPSARESSGPANSTMSSPPQQTRPGASPDQERQLSEQHGHWTRGGSSASSDLAASSSIVSSLQLDAGASKQARQQPKRSSGGAQANRWTHFGARLRPLTSGSQQLAADHYHEAASSSKANMAERSVGPTRMNSAPSQSSARNQLAPLQGNSVEGPAPNRDDNDEDEDDLDSEAILYKLMQQSNFLMNPNFQDQPQRQPARSVNVSPGSNQQQQQQLQPTAAAVNNQQQFNNDDELAKSKRVIKLLKSYSHIHQVDDSDDQIRGAYTRYPKPSRPASIGQRRPIGGQQQHIFISSVPVTTSQTRATARVYANNDEEDDGQYRTPRPAAARPSSRDDEGAPAESSSGPNSNGPEQDEDDFECPNNGIFADVASGCQAYHVCQSASQVQQRFQCPLGTLFNDIILTCDFAHNVMCGKKPGELAGAAFPAQSANQQQQQPLEQPQTSRYRAQTSAGVTSGQSQQRPASNGPRHLVIGSPYNLHNAQQRPAQSQPPTLSAYPPVKPLSNSIALIGPNDNNNNNGDEDDENEPDEPLVPATLPPRSNSNPPPNFQSAHSSQAATPTNFGPDAQEPATRSQQPVYKSAYQRQQTPSRTLSSHQQQQQRPRYQPDSDASSTPASNFGASAAPPTFIEPNQNRQKSFSQQDSATVQAPTESQANDMQSFSLVINHMAPAVLPKQPTATTENNYNQQPNVPQNKQESTRAGISAGQRSSVQSQQVAVALQQRANQQVTTQPANTNPRTHWVEAAAPLSSVQQPNQPQQKQSIQRLAPRGNLPSAALPSSQRFRTEPVATSTVASTRQASRYGRPTTSVTSQAQLQRVASAVASSTAAGYEETTTAASQSSVSHQHSQQHQQPRASFAGNKNDNSEADLAAQEIAVRQQQAAKQQPRLLQDQSAPNEDVLNDGMFLIIRHNARAPPVQVVGATQAVAAVAAPAPTATSDGNVVQKFGGVERVVAPSRGVPVKQQTHQVYGLLPPMEPPAPQAHDHQHKQQLAGQQQQRQQQQQQQQYAANSDQLVPSASSLPAASNVETTANKQQHSTTSTTTPSSSSSRQTPPTEVRVKGQKRQTAPNKSAQKQQPRAIRVAKRLKAVATPPKPLHQTNDTSAANKATGSKLAENVAPTSP